MSALRQIYASNGDSEVPGFLEGARSRDLVEPLSEEEQQRIHPWSWLKWWDPLYLPSHSPLQERLLLSYTVLLPGTGAAEVPGCAPCSRLPRLTCQPLVRAVAAVLILSGHWCRDHTAEPSQMLWQCKLAVQALSKCLSFCFNCRRAATSPSLPDAQVCPDAQPYRPERAAPQQHAQLRHARTGAPAGAPCHTPCLLPCKIMQAGPGMRP